MTNAPWEICDIRHDFTHYTPRFRFLHFGSFFGVRTDVMWVRLHTQVYTFFFEFEYWTNNRYFFFFFIIFDFIHDLYFLKSFIEIFKKIKQKGYVYEYFFFKASNDLILISHNIAIV